MTIDVASIESAQQRIKNHIRYTPLIRSPFLEKELKFTAPIFLKQENLQKTGSFKVRGASNKLLKMLEQGKRPAQVFAASAGNHAQGVAYICGASDVPCKIFMPEGTPLNKVNATQTYGAQVQLGGESFAEADQLAREEFKKNKDALFIHAFDDEDVVQGQGTAGLEIYEQLKSEKLSTENLQLIVPMGGGGFASGLSIALASKFKNLKAYGVVSQAVTILEESFKGKKLLPSKKNVLWTIADGLAVKNPSELTFSIILKYFQDVKNVQEDEIAVAIYHLMDKNKSVCEGGGAAGVAAALFNKFDLNPEIPLVIPLCGGNIDLNVMSNILERAHKRESRWTSVSVVAEDRPGQLARICEIVSQEKANLLDLAHDRSSQHCPLGYTFIHLRLETRNALHAQQIQLKLKEEGYKLQEGG